jgi:hypothetical protein
MGSKKKPSSSVTPAPTDTQPRRRPPSNKNSKLCSAPPTSQVITSTVAAETVFLQATAVVPQQTQIPNIILHLKCFMKDLNDHQIPDEYQYNPVVPPEIVAYNKNDTQYSFLPDGTSAAATGVTDGTTALDGGCLPPPTTDDIYCSPALAAAATAAPQQTTDEYINSKLKQLKISLFKGHIDNKSACFWCSHDFENEPCYIPKYETDNSIYVYGCFCSPECAAGFLFRENIDDSVMFERFHLMNQIYGGIYGYEKNIQPAPNPYYTLSKYYGNLSIEEYRALTQMNRLFLVVDRPLTRVLPELHEEKDRGVIGSGSGIYRVKRQSDMANRPSKNDILREVFGVS